MLLFSIIFLLKFPTFIYFKNRKKYFSNE